MLLTGVKLLTLPPLTEISPTVKLLVASLKVNVIAAVSPTFNAAALLVMLSVGGTVSTTTPRVAVTDGVATIGCVIIAAALIMASVFFAFMTGVDRTIKEFGLALGLAIILDAFVIRLTLVPALMHLLDGKAWYIPRWLDKILPRLTIEAPNDK